MARIRTIKPEFPQSESMGNVSREARLLFILLWSLCDDHGKARGSSRLLASLLYPYDKDVPDLIDAWFDELVREDCVIRYEVAGAQFVKVVKWLEHQKIDRPSASKFPDPDEGSIILAKPREPSSLDQGSRTEGRDHGSEEAEGSAREGSRAEAAAAPERSAPPGDRRGEQDAALGAWNDFAGTNGLRRVDYLTSSRRFRLDRIFAICGGIEGWKATLDHAPTQEFLRAADGGWQGWFHFDWLLDEDKFTRLMEGSYAERNRNDKSDERSVSAGLAGFAQAGSR